LEGYNKFIPYYLHPRSVYSVGLSKSSFRTKVSVGSNPWAKDDRLVNLAKICERYGGGGHARVGAISFDVKQEQRAREAAREIVEELRASVQSNGCAVNPASFNNCPRLTQVVALPSVENLISPLSSEQKALCPAPAIAGSAATL